jgi:hypothetical protein
MTLTREQAINRLMTLNDNEGNNVLDMIDGNECGFLTANGDTLWAHYIGAKELTCQEGEELWNNANK